MVGPLKPSVSRWRCSAKCWGRRWGLWATRSSMVALHIVPSNTLCSGPSMEPTIVNHDVVFSERMSRHLCKIQKGDIVIAKSPFDPNMNICKRVIGLEGDKVCTSGSSSLFKSHTYVPKGHVWLEGDNLTNSSDSRSYGPVPYALIRGRVCLKLWPLHSVGTLSKSPTKRIIKTQSDSDSD
ncbi:mitochondrial inner membrane protease subunit 1 isoform X1 [Chaetodon trifascialis]|uniref:mitochondrial inner membrane protease subunit 1 isoform X1 n=1 Tax=Chaetodon trifascialis TaxID=109706 RepID=UPI00399545B5